MNDTRYTPELAAEGERAYDVIASVPDDSRFLVKLMTDTFINGMLAQKRLSAQTQSPARQSSA